MPKVSVIMPVYNGARFVGKAIESVLTQKFQDWELIVVNDGSTDSTPEILAGFADQRIRIIHQQNSGEACARNRGLDAARGEYVAFLDADDLYLPNALGDMTAYLDAHPQFDALFSDGYFCDENDRVLGRLSDVRPGPFTGNILEPLLLDPGVIAGIICTMTRYETILDSQVRFDTDLVIGPDWDFWIHLARFARFGYMDRPTCMYRVHQSNVTKTAGIKRRKNDLVKGRLKVMKADWFPELTEATRRKFFYNLLLDLLDNNSEKQQAIMEDPLFLKLSQSVQADLVRLVASSHLRRGENKGFAVQCLKRALSLAPRDLKAKLLLWLVENHPSLVSGALSMWSTFQGFQTRIRTFGRRRPRPVPAALLPAAD